MASNEKLRELSIKAAKWLKILAPIVSDGKEVEVLANDLEICAKGCAACGGPNRDCPCERDE